MLPCALEKKKDNEKNNRHNSFFFIRIRVDILEGNRLLIADPPLMIAFDIHVFIYPTFLRKYLR